MENPEEVLQSLDEFAKLKPKDIPRELEDYLSYVAKTGDPVYQWSIVKCLFREKLLNVITDFYETSPTIDLPPCPNVDPFNYEIMKNSLLERLESFSSAPFTVQRLCELLTTPRKEYSRADKFMRAIEKNILVVSTREPGNIRRSDNNGQPELMMNGVMDGRGIELGEAIETVSSEGVNLMHSEENDVNVTESETVPVECAGMEEIDMEEQGDHMEASNSSTWEKEQPESDVSVQNEETGSQSNSEDGEIKTKEAAESSEVNSSESDKTDSETTELSVATEKAVDTFSDAVAEDSPGEESDTKPLDNKDSSEKNEEKCDAKADCSKVEDSKVEEKILEPKILEPKTLEPKSEETTENSTQDSEPSILESVSETNTSSDPNPEALEPESSTNEDIPKPDAETVPAMESPIKEEEEEEEEEAAAAVAAESVTTDTASSDVDRPSSTEPVTDSGDIPKIDSTTEDISPAETCTTDVGKDVNVDSTTSECNTAEIVNNTENVTSPELKPVAESDSASVEETGSTDTTAEQVPLENVENGSEIKIEQDTVDAVVCQQDEAMEVDENASSQQSGPDTDEPMDQSEQPTEES